MKNKFEKCQVEKSACKSTGGTPDLDDRSSNSLAPVEEHGPYSGYHMTQGKCRGDDKYSYNRKHIYNLKTLYNQGVYVDTEQGCADYCNENDECKGF